MSALPTTRRDPAHAAALPIPPLDTGDRLTAEEFDRRYAAAPETMKAELIEGVVYVASPVSDNHGSPHFDISVWLGLYRWATPGVVGSSDGTIRLDSRNRPQPDVHLRLRPEYGGQAHVSDDNYVVGAPELIVEVSASTTDRDLHEKLTAYAQNSVREYIVWRTQDGAIDWFRLENGAYVRVPPDADGFLRSTAFPGLWLDPQALISGDTQRLEAVARRGLASPDHADFVARLQAIQGVLL